MQLGAKAEGALRFGDLPDVSLAALPEGLGQAELRSEEALDVLLRFSERCGPASPRERQRVLHGACLGALSRVERRSLLERVGGGVA